MLSKDCLKKAKLKPGDQFIVMRGNSKMNGIYTLQAKTNDTVTGMRDGKKKVFRIDNYNRFYRYDPRDNFKKAMMVML